jgi:acetolactate synthase-1/2/3 large subunit
MSGQEITVAIEQELPVIFVILNDSALGMVKHGQRLGGAEQTGYGLPTINFAAFAEVLGAPGIVIESPEDLHALDIERLCSRRGPTVLDVRIDGEEVPPMQSRMRMLQGG